MGKVEHTGGMRRFATLAAKLGTSTKTNDRLEALENYFSEADDADKVWVIALFSGRRPKRTVNTTLLWEWCREVTGWPGWLFEECYHTVGDLAETIALLLPEGAGEVDDGADEAASEGGRSLTYYLLRLAKLGKEEETVKKNFVLECWASMNSEERFIFNKLITGGWRIGISQQTVVNALARATGAEAAVIAHRISGDWDPATTPYEALISGEGGGSELSRPYPFYLAYALEEEPAALGDPSEWQAEWKWDGIRGQVIRRGGQLFVWSRGEELMTEKFPEYQAWTERLPEGVVLDGEIIGLGSGPRVADGGGRVAAGGEGTEDGEGGGERENGGEITLDFVPLPFAALQTRIGRKNVTKKILQEVAGRFHCLRPAGI